MRTTKYGKRTPVSLWFGGDPWPGVQINCQWHPDVNRHDVSNFSIHDLTWEHTHQLNKTTLGKPVSSSLMLMLSLMHRITIVRRRIWMFWFCWWKNWNRNHDQPCPNSEEGEFGKFWLWQWENWNRYHDQLHPTIVRKENMGSFGSSSERTNWNQDQPWRSDRACSIP